MDEIRDTAEFRGARFRNVDLTGVKMVDVMLVDAAFSGLIDGLTINDVEVAPLISAEMDRRYPERARLFVTDPAGLRAAWSSIEEMWQPTIERARHLPDELRRSRVDGEWSLLETLRHLVFVTDSWISRVVLGEARPYHPLALPPSFVGGLSDVGIDTTADPSFEEVLAARESRVAVVRDLLDRVSGADLERRCDPNMVPGYPPETTHTVLACVHVVIDEEWAHHRFAVRDLDALTGA